MLSNITPGATKFDIDKMLGWVQAEEEIIEKGVINYKMPKYAKKAPKLNNKLNFKHLKDFWHIFVNMDRNHDGEFLGLIFIGFLNFEDLKVKYQHLMSDDDIESFFRSVSKTREDQLDLEEFFKIMLPEDCILPTELIETECKEYVKYLETQKIKEEAKEKAKTKAIKNPKK